jgi:hypothetical protein
MDSGEKEHVQLLGKSSPTILALEELGFKFSEDEEPQCWLVNWLQANRFNTSVIDVLRTFAVELEDCDGSTVDFYLEFDGDYQTEMVEIEIHNLAGPEKEFKIIGKDGHTYSMGEMWWTTEEVVYLSDLIEDFYSTEVLLKSE